MHLPGLRGMPRRVYTYPAEMGWQALNIIATAGAFMLATGVVVFLIDLVRNLRPSLSEHAGNVWQAGTLEWMPNHVYGPRSIPLILSRYPLWQQPNLEQETEAGRHYLANAPTGARARRSSPRRSRQSRSICNGLPGPGWSPFLAAVFTAAFFMLLTVKWVTAALICGALAIAFVLIWTWGNDPEPLGDVDIGLGTKVPAYMTGPTSHAWWAAVILVLVAGSLYLSFVFSYLYLWTVAPQGWSSAALPAPAWPLAAAALLAVSAASAGAASRLLRQSRLLCAVALLVALASLGASSWIELAAHWRSGLRPETSGYAALVYLASALQLQIVAALAIMGLDLLARLAAGRADNVRRVTFDCLALLIYYAAGQGLLGLLLVHGFPRVVA